MEQLAQKRLHLLLRKCFASRWPLTRVLSNLWSTQCRGGLIILNYISKRQRRWEEQLIHHCGTDPQLTRRSKSKVPGEKAKTNRESCKHDPGVRSSILEGTVVQGNAIQAWGVRVSAHTRVLAAGNGRYRLLPLAFQLNYLQWAWWYIVICLWKGMLLFDHFQLRCE